MVNTVIFDFDGVIADSDAIFIETLEQVLNRSKPFSDAEIKQMRSSSPREIIKMLGIKKWQVPVVIAKGKKGVAARMHKVKVFNNMPETVKKLHANGYKIYILSTNSEEAISNILIKSGLRDCVTRIYSGTRLFGKAKRLNKLLLRENLDKNNCVYIGDEVRDIEASQHIGLRIIAVGWGYNEFSTLKSLKPTALATTPKDLMIKINSL